MAANARTAGQRPLGRLLRLICGPVLADDAYGWLEEHGGLTRANGDRFRQMVPSCGNTEDLAKMYAAWRRRAPNADAMKKDRELEPETNTH
jgi:Zn-dependent oligopeptidase